MISNWRGVSSVKIQSSESRCSGEIVEKHFRLFIGALHIESKIL